MPSDGPITIFVALLEEGTAVWRPVQAEALGKDLFRIVSRNPDPEDEHWEFSSGEIVRCVRKALHGERAAVHLVAVARA